MSAPRRSQVPGVLAQAVADITHVTAQVNVPGTDVSRIMRALDVASDTTYGPGSANLDPTTGSLGGDVTLTPTEAAAAAGQGVDQQLALRRLVGDVLDATAALRAAVVGYVGPAEAAAATRHRPITDTDEGCSFHALVGAWAPVDRISDCGGNLDKARPVSRAVYDRIRVTGHAPSKAEMRDYIRLGRWPATRRQLSRTRS